ncbi:MAG TPA: hypothetical protein VFA46_11180 [Actinomycetes bacterium]|jgi:hypothetical protein|nr:hypothetical protein [Actinomycetes bacterium]
MPIVDRHPRQEPFGWHQPPAAGTTVPVLLPGGDGRIRQPADSASATAVESQRRAG